MSIVASILLALLVDRLLGEPKRFHPLVGFGWLASAIEGAFNRSKYSRFAGAYRSVLGWMLAVLPWVAIATMLQLSLANERLLDIVIGGFILYLAIGWRSLLQHADAVAKPLEQNDLVSARSAVAMIVSRDTTELDETAVASAATESVLENGADAIFSAIFWFCLLGIPGVVLYRLSNTLDAMWGYKNPRFLHYGWAAARIDDLLNFIPARLTALSYTLVGETKIAMCCWRSQAPTWKSPNAGPVMAAGAGAINVSLGGAAVYHGQLQVRPPLGPETGERPDARAIREACALVNRTLLLWCAMIALMAGGAFLL